MPRKLKIGIVCYPSQGGSGVIATELAISLARRGHHVHLFSYARPFRLSQFHQNLLMHEVEVAAYPLLKYPPYSLALATKLVEVTKHCKLDIIHAHYAVPHATSAYLARQLLAPHVPKVVTTLHGTDITLVGADPAYRPVVKFSVEQSDGVTAVSRYLRRRTLEEFDVANEIEVIPNFVDTERFSGVVQACERRRFAPNDEPLLVHASNFRPVKRISDVVRIFARVREQMPAKLLMIGEGPERMMAQQLLREFKLFDDAFFLGEQEFPENIYACADVFLLPSEQESFGLAALEAMSSGVPVVASDVGGLPEVVAHGECGFLHPVGDVAGMAASVLQLLRNPDLHLRFRDAARKRAVEHFEQGKIVQQYEEFYFRVLDA